MGTATLGFAGGPGVTFRVDPDDIYWDWEIITNVIETLGGRVIQVLGARLNDLIITGSLGMDRSAGYPQDESWRQAEAFLTVIRDIMEFQSSDSRQQDKMHPPAVFTYPPKGWRFQCYVEGIDDADSPGSSIVMTPGKYNQRYQLSLFIVSDAAETLVKAGQGTGVLGDKQSAAISAYMARISDGIGWHFSQYNGHIGGAPTKVPKGGGGGAPSRNLHRAPAAQPGSPAPAPARPTPGQAKTASLSGR